MVCFVNIQLIQAIVENDSSSYVSESDYAKSWAMRGSSLYSRNANPCDLILEMLAENVSAAEILEDFPDLEPEDIQACLLFAARRTDFPRLTA